MRALCLVSPAWRALGETSASVCVCIPSRFVEIKEDYDKRKLALKDLSRQPSQDGSDTVPAAAALSFRTAANALKFAMTQRSGRSGASSPALKHQGGFEAPVEEEPAVDDQTDEETDEELFSVMQGQWVEVECLLRVQLRSEEALEEARTRVAASIAFYSGLGQLVSSSGTLMGTIFQALLARADGNEASTAASIGLDLDDGAWAAQTSGADALRKLVRIKVQDDNDLKAANGALSSCSEFFSNLRVYGSRNALGAVGVITKLDESF